MCVDDRGRHAGYDRCVLANDRVTRTNVAAAIEIPRKLNKIDRTVVADPAQC